MNKKHDLNNGQYTSTTGGNYYGNYRGVIFPHWTKLQEGDVRVSGNIYGCSNGERYTDGKVV